MNLQKWILAAVSATLLHGCTDRPLDAGKAATPKAAAPTAPAPTQDKTAFKQEIPIGPGSPHTVGRFDSASGRLVAGKSEVGALLFGPYERLPAGRYKVTYVFSAEADSEGQEVGMLDVGGFIPPNKPVDILAQAPLKSARAEQSVALSFEARNPDYVYQYRVWTNGNGKRVAIKSVVVEKM